MLKLNFDENAHSNPGMIGQRDFIRDHSGYLIYAYATPLRNGTNNQEEVEVSIWSLSWCLTNGI